MSRLLLTGLMAASVMITGCQQQKVGSEPQPAAQPAASATPPPRSNTPPPRSPPPGAGPVYQQPPPGNGAGPVYNPPPPPPGNGAGPISNGPPPPPGNYPPPPPGNGAGGNYPPPPPGNGAGGTYYPPPSNTPPPTTVRPTDPTYPPYTPSEPPTNYPPATPPTNTTPTGTPPTTVNPPTQQPTPPNLQPAPTVPSVDMPPQNYPSTPPCTGVNCGNQQIIPQPAPPQQQPPVAQQQPIQQPPMQQPPMQQQPPMGPPAPPMNKPMAPPAQQQPNGPGAPPFTVDKPAPGPSIDQPGTVPVAQPPVVEQQPPVVEQGPKQECRPIPLSMELSTTKLDVLFVIDTSASMRDGRRSGMTGELGMIAKQMASFARNLDPKTDFRIGLLLGHGPEDSKHPGYKHGTLFQVNSSDPAVIDFSKMLKECGNGKNARECAYTKVVAALEKKMHSLPTDHSDAQGEALMLSLYDAATNDGLRQGIMKQGLFRKDAVLSIIPISDEQDVCYDYDTCTQNEGEDETAFKARCTPAQVKWRDAKGKLTGQVGQDQHEVNFFRDFCKRAVNKTSPLTPSNVLTALQNMKDGDIRKLAITPIVYLDNSKPVRAQDENEMGHGYIELAQFGKGMVADLNTAHLPKGESNFEPILKNFATFIDTKMKMQPPFLCSSDYNPEGVDLQTMDIHIEDQNGKDMQLFNPTCKGENCAGDVQSTLATDSNGRPTHVIVDLNGMKLYKALQAHGFKKGNVHMKFKNRSDFDAHGNRKQRTVFRPKRKVRSASLQLPGNDSALDQLQQ